MRIRFLKNLLAFVDRLSDHILPLIFGEFQYDLLGFGIGSNDPDRRLEVNSRIKTCIPEFYLLIGRDLQDPVESVGSDLLQVIVKPDQVPAVPVLFQQVGVDPVKIGFV